MNIRSARGEDCDALTALALRSKASWGYDEDFMTACCAELTVPPEAIERDQTFVLEAAAGTLLGFYQLRIAGQVGEVEAFFIDANLKRGGFGRHLWQHLETTARAHGVARLELDSDPYAEVFYQAMGMVRSGESPSGSIPGRVLPFLTKSLRTQIIVLDTKVGVTF